MKNIIYIALGVIALITYSCTDTNKKSVKYISTSAISAYNLQYLDENGELISKEVNPESAMDVFTYSYMADEGDIVYISGNYKDINSALKLMILVDGKVYKQAQNENDTISFLTISGTLPY